MVRRLDVADREAHSLVVKAQLVVDGRLEHGRLIVDRRHVLVVVEPHGQHARVGERLFLG